MLIYCPSCQAKYLLNSADLYSDGRKVRCAKCKYQWFQKPNIDYQQSLNNTKKKVLKDSSNYNKTLPSTYVEAKKISLTNSLLMIIFIVFIFVIYFLIKNLDQGIINLIKYYLQESIPSINKIINDLAQIFYKVVN